jgi:predicted dinucleotide-binding enzyme
MVRAIVGSAASHARPRRPCRSPLAAVIEQLGPKAKAGSITGAAAAYLVVLSVPWQQVQPALAGLPA